MVEKEKIEQEVQSLIKLIQRLVGTYRQLMDGVRLERDAIANADIKHLNEVVLNKEGVIETIRSIERERVASVNKIYLISGLRKRNLEGQEQHLTFNEIIELVQGFNLPLSETLRQLHQTMQVLVGRVRDLNDYNQKLVAKSLEHIERMKRNTFGEASAGRETYTPKGQRQNPGSVPRFVSKEI